MVEVDYSGVGYNMFAPLGKGLGIMALKVDGVADTETITTPFKRCVPVVTSAIGTPNIDVMVTESAGVVTFAGTTTSTTYQVIIMGAMY